MLIHMLVMTMMVLSSCFHPIHANRKPFCFSSSYLQNVTYPNCETKIMKVASCIGWCLSSSSTNTGVTTCQTCQAYETTVYPTKLNCRSPITKARYTTEINVIAYYKCACKKTSKCKSFLGTENMVQKIQ